MKAQAMNRKGTFGRFAISQKEILDSQEISTTYDVFLSVVSWETRSLAATDLLGRVGGRALLLRFSSSDEIININKDKHQAKILSCCEDGHIINMKTSLDFNDNVRSFETILRDEYIRLGRPIRMLVDISCFPKSYLSFLCGVGFEQELLAKLDCIYSLGKYQMTEAGDVGPLSVISEGEWQSLQIPYLESTNSFSSERDIIVALGGEIAHSLPFIDKYEPSKLSVLFIKDGFHTDSASVAEKAAYDEIVQQPMMERRELEISDMVGALEYIHEFCKNSSSPTITGLAIGAKPHSMALALAALDIEKLEIVCRMPSKYAGSNVTHTGRVILYSISDRFEPTAYF
jgi:hypothetical protein